MANKFFFEILFAPKRYAEDVMDVGSGMIGVVKTNKYVFCKDTIENMGGDSMSANHLRTTVKWNLPPLYYIFHKPEPLGIEFKTLACYNTRAFLLL